ncbi:integrase [Achromobacter animicus]|uniref:tyrosine-type recombinase/integrase n=1 Tax=Achromobacter animicus TaxID=1389935 RepID=UPI0028B10E49|nr:integrase [Achromobacter animicus]
MASIQKTPKGYRAQVKTLGVRDSQVFPTRREAVEWGARRELEIKEGKTKHPGQIKTLRDALRRYGEEVSINKRGERWEQIRLAAFEQPSYRLPLDAPLADVTPQHIADFRDVRGLKLKDSSVLRELTLLSSVFETARLEWGWAKTNPCKDIRKPREGKHRERVIAWWELRLILRKMGHRPRARRIETVAQAVALATLTALRTGMRAGELCGLTWERVYQAHAHLPVTKNGDPRNVPLSRRALALLERAKGWDDERVLGLTTATLDALFRKYRARAGLEGFTFHDTRHTAATMLAKKLHILDLCKMFGWKNPAMAMVYYNPHASTIAAQLD